MRTIDGDDVASKVIDYVKARAQQVGAQAWADIIPIDHPNYRDAQVRVQTAAGVAHVALWRLGFELHAGEDVVAFTGRVDRAWAKGYAIGFDQNVLEPATVAQPFPEPEACEPGCIIDEPHQGEACLIGDGTGTHLHDLVRCDHDGHQLLSACPWAASVEAPAL